MSSGFDRLGANVPGKRVMMLATAAAALLAGHEAVHPAPAMGAAAEPPAVAQTLLAPAPPNRTVARQQGYTGDQCSNCESIRMKVSGHCAVCEDCGTTTGCS